VVRKQEPTDVADVVIQHSAFCSGIQSFVPCELMYSAIVCSDTAGGDRGKITRHGHMADKRFATTAGYPIIRVSESQRRYALLRAVPNSSPRWKRWGFFGFFVSDQNFRDFHSKYLSFSFSLFSVATDMPCRVEQEVGRSCGFLRNEQRKTPLAVGVFHQPISYPRTPAIEEHSLLLLRSRISITWQEVDIR